MSRRREQENDTYNGYCSVFSDFTLGYDLSYLIQLDRAAYAVLQVHFLFPRPSLHMISDLTKCCKRKLFSLEMKNSPIR